MSRILIDHGTVILPDALLKNAPVLIEGGKIVSVDKNTRCPEGFVTIDARGCFVSPGFIDAHIHGSPDAIFKNEVKSGTTSIIIAESCVPSSEISEKIHKIEEFVIRSPFGRNVLGVRLEGPYISKEKAGAQDRRYIKSADTKEAREIIKICGPLLKMITIAPEIEGIHPVIRLLKRRGIKASIGHTNATYKEALDGIAAGIDHATHVFNAMSDGVVSAALPRNKITAEVILDLVHVSKERFKFLVKIKGVDKVILVTDSVRAEYGDKKIRPGSVYRLKDGTIAGSCLLTIGALENAVKACGISLVDAVRMLTVNPAKFFGVLRRKGKIAVGMDADIVIFDKNFNIRTTIIGGKICAG